MKKPEISYEEIVKLLTYIPSTGVFLWNIKPSVYAEVGAEAGCPCDAGRIITIRGFSYYAHRLAYLFMTQSWPPQDVKILPKDGNICNIEWDNLLFATAGEAKALQEYKADGQTISGLCWDGDNMKWRATIKLNGKYLIDTRSKDKEKMINRLREVRRQLYTIIEERTSLEKDRIWEKYSKLIGI